MPCWGPVFSWLLAAAVAGVFTDGWGEFSKFTLISWLCYLTVGAYWAIVIVWKPLPVRDMLGARPSGANARLLVGAILAYLGVLLGWLYVMDQMGWIPEPPDEQPSATATAASMVMTVVLAPPVEEILFRGILLPKLAGRVGPIAAVLLSSAIFATLHPEPLGSLLFSVVMVCLYVRTRSLWVPILAHSLGNLLVLALDAAGLLTLVFSRGWLAVGALVVSLPWLATFFRRGLRDLHRIPGFVERARAVPRHAGAEQTASPVPAASAPGPEPVLVADEAKAEAEPH